MYATVDTASILIIDDSPGIVSLMEQVLGAAGYETLAASDGEKGLLSAFENHPEVIILDLGLPGRDGLAMLKELRELGGFAPVLILSGRDSVADRVIGLDAGADDYMSKPFDAAELVARIGALVRRSALRKRSTPLMVGDVHLDPISREVRRNGRVIPLSQREFALLEFMMRNPERVLTREMIAGHVWKHVPIALEETNVVNVYVRYLRRKLHGDGEVPVLHTIRHQGYRFHFGEIDPEPD